MNAVVTAHQVHPHHKRAKSLNAGLIWELPLETVSNYEQNIAVVVPKDLSTHQTQHYPPLTNSIDFKMMPIEFCAICSPT